jgi:hypothetical protein
VTPYFYRSAASASGVYVPPSYLGGDFEQLAGLPPPADSLAWFDWQATLYNRRLGDALYHYVPSTVTDTFYFDDTNGDDASGDGSIGNPWRTLSKFNSESLAFNGAARWLFKRGEIFRPANLTDGIVIRPQSIVGAYGTGPAPQWQAFTLPYASGWSLDTGDTYVRAEGTTVMYAAFQDLTKAMTRPLTEAASVASCRTTPDSWIYSGGNLYVNLGGEVPNNVGSQVQAHRGFAPAGAPNSAYHVEAFGDRILVRDIVFRGFGLATDVTKQRHGVVFSGTGQNVHSAMIDCIAIESGYHTVSQLGPIRHVMTGCTLGLCQRGPGGQTVGVTYSDAGGQETLIYNHTTCAGNLPTETFGVRMVGTSSYYGHTAGAGTVKLFVNNGHVHTPGPYSPIIGAGVANSVPASTIDELRSFLVNQLRDEGTARHISVYGAPGGHADINPYYRGLVTDQSARSFGSSSTGWTINGRFIAGPNGGGFARMFGDSSGNGVESGGTYANCRFEMNAAGGIFRSGFSAAGHPGVALHNCIVVGSRVDSYLNISNSAGRLRNNAYFLTDPSDPAYDASIFANGPGKGAIADPGKVTLASIPADGVPGESSVLYDAADGGLLPQYDAAGTARGQVKSIGPWSVAGGGGPILDVATALAYRVQPSDAQETVAIAPPIKVEARNALNLFNPDFTGLVTVAMQPGGAGGVATGTTSRNAVSGVATFNDVAVSKEGLDYVMIATSPGLTQALSEEFEITGPWNPSQITAGTVGLFFGDPSVTEYFQDTARTTPAVPDGTGDTKRVKGLTPRVGPVGTQSTTANAPILTSTGLQADATTVRLLLGSIVTANVSSAYTMYIVGNAGSGEFWPAGSQDNNSYVGFRPSFNVVQTSNGQCNTCPSGRFTMRIRRTTGGDTRFKYTGVAEANATSQNGAKFDLDEVFIGLYSAAGGRLEMILFVTNADISGTADETSLSAWLLDNGYPAF